MSDREHHSNPDSSPERHLATTSCLTEDKQQDPSTGLEQFKGEAREANKETDCVAEGSQKAPLCRFFKKTGKCRYGDGCKFAHEITAAPKKEEEDEPSAEGNDDGGDKQDGRSKTSYRGEQKVCRFFSRSGWCRHGNRCRFLHEQTITHAPSNPDEAGVSPGGDAGGESPKEIPQDGASASKAENDKEKPGNAKRVCRFFRAGHCKAGDGCRFAHRRVEGPDPPSKVRGDRQAVPRPSPFQESMKIAELGQEDLQRLRETELAQLTKRFPGERMTRVETEGSDEPVYRLTINPTDPDWPYDIKDFEFEVMFPTSYPSDPFTISMPEDQVLPNSVLTHMQESIVEWILARHGTNQIAGKVELMFRPFLRWLDRSLENLFTEAAKQFKKVVHAKAAGIEFVPYAKQQPSEPRDISKYYDVNHPTEAEGVMTKAGTAPDQDPNAAGEAQSGDTVTGGTPPAEAGSPAADEMEGRPDAAASTGRDPNKYADLFNVQRHGTEIKFSRVELSEGVATLVAHTVGVVIRCSRCKSCCDVLTPPKRVNMARCGKCQHQQLLTFRPSLVHHFTATLGFLDLVGCTTFDLILADCEFSLGCLNCSEETKVTGLQFGQTRTTWCEKCHTKMKLLLETAKFHQLQVQGIDTRDGQKPHVVPVRQLRNQPHPDVREGYPLPNNGACKHYKKSYRWFRFPCCGKCYPCDECHGECEADHEMKYATRMICGFCCKEQQYSPDKPCISCLSMTTKGRTSHWEGGTGCRNRSKMSRNDKQKYSNTNKTVSKKQQKLAE